LSPHVSGHAPRRQAGFAGGSPGPTGDYDRDVPDPKLEIQLLYDRILVKISPEDGERRSSGGIVIPATAQMARRLAWGDVLGVGNNTRTVQTGDRVLFNPEDQFEVEIQGDTYLVMRERDVHALASERTDHGTGLYL
jgi:chaperonin GroES